MSCFLDSSYRSAICSPKPDRRNATSLFASMVGWHGFFLEWMADNQAQQYSLAMSADRCWDMALEGRAITSAGQRRERDL